MWSPLALLGAACLLQVLAEDPSHRYRYKRLTTFGKTPTTETEPKKLHQACNYDHECVQGAECVVNSTVKVNEKRCYCRFGYVEEENTCNRGLPVYGQLPLILFLILALITLQTN